MSRIAFKSSNKNNEAKKAPGCLGIGWCLFSSIFILVGLGISIQQARLWTWEEAPCQIVEFKIRDNANKDKPFAAQVRFQFQNQGQEFIGTRIDSNDNRFANYEKLLEVEKEASQRGTCYFEPEQPEEAILARKSSGVWAGLAFATFGSFFFLIGIVILRSEKKSQKAISSRESKTLDLKEGIAGFGFFGIFAAAGLAIFLGVVLPTAKKYLRAKSWQPTTATVIWSKVRSHRSDDSTTYSPDIFYRYYFQDQAYHSNSFSLLSGSSSGHAKKKDVVEAHPKGHNFTCYVNPKKPWQAVVERKLGWWALFGLFPLPFLAVGLGGLGWMIFGSKKDPNASGRRTDLRSSGGIEEDKKPKKPKGGNRWGKFFGHLLLALFWCGIVSVFVFQVWKSWANGDPEWLLTIFITPFVLVGLFLLFSLPHSFLAIFSPRFDLSFRDQKLKLGVANKFRWKQIGGSGELTNLTLTLVGQEEATYQQGTDRTTATSIFYCKEIFKTSHLPEMISNECDLIFPSDSLPSFTGQHNKIRWLIQMHAEVRKRPDVKETIELEIQPLAEVDFR